MNCCTDNDRLTKLRALQLEEIKLIEKFIDICEKERLTYYILGGTMLGAVRHHGFIPWDDDADFGMPRPDYEKFLLVANRYLSDGMNLSSFDGEKNIFYSLRLESKAMKMRSYGVNGPHTYNVYIDIFPLDGMPNNFLKNRIHQTRLLFLRTLYYISLVDRGVRHDDPKRKWLAKFVVFVCYHIKIQKIMSPSKRWNGIDSALKKYSYTASNFLVNAMGGYKMKEMFRKDVFGEGALYEFEGMQLRGPVDYETYLTQLYGDYMTPPPENERNWHGTEI